MATKESEKKLLCKQTKQSAVDKMTVTYKKSVTVLFYRVTQLHLSERTNPCKNNESNISTSKYWFTMPPMDEDKHCKQREVYFSPLVYISR